MDVSSVLEGLNAAQRDAVAAPTGNILVLAGAGSGKTRVLVHRIAWYIETGETGPHGILAVTFTNKAAAEMRGRIETLLRRPGGGMWVGTFHGIAHRLLRTHWQRAGLSENFQIMDSDDQLRAVRRVIRTLELDENEYSPKESQWFINARKEEGLRTQHLDDRGDPGLRMQVDIYRRYQASCEQAGLVDFAELLLRAHELFRDQPDLLAGYRERFRHVLVDEFQDTNALQYAWLQLLAGASGAVFAVGDDDQSIYSFRGARMENMQRFERDFGSTRLLRLEQNYRSTGNILKAANSLINHNATRLGKELWTEGADGESIPIYAAYNELDEARFVVDRMIAAHATGESYQDCAVLYRTSAQSRLFEEALIQSQIPYRVYGGMRFYERAEIKDAIAYLRLASFRDDDASFERIVNTPPRRIGQRTIDHLRSVARNERRSLWQAALLTVRDKMLAARSIAALEQFLKLVHALGEEIANVPLGEAVERAIAASALPDHYRKETGEKGLSRIENLDELANAAREFQVDPQVHGELAPLQAFLAHAALESGDTQADAHSDCVQLMTLHSAKGLEFNSVWLVGLEEGLFPHQRSSDDLQQLEEERRLCYVGITRARRRLTLSHAQHRRMHGAEFYPQPSRFLRELPGEVLSEVRLGGAVTQLRGAAVTPSAAAGHAFRLGQRVLHARFGEGVVLDLEGQGSQTRIRVNFAQAGSKWLVLAYANLQAA